MALSLWPSTMAYRDGPVASHDDDGEEQVHLVLMRLAHSMEDLILVLQVSVLPFSSCNTPFAAADLDFAEGGDETSVCIFPLSIAMAVTGAERETRARHD
ncbi:hypothetical protein HPP92_017475 [Vanilla planifolia]|uniref:Uncharacterized protein n=1 Tax=Vanilla planifolia TaxID=51239 RepID=A0A835QHU1_VANPL|nr:hypothetical protein HPP92_017475 [Vanilla planifolia]